MYSVLCLLCPGRYWTSPGLPNLVKCRWTTTLGGKKEERIEETLELWNNYEEKHYKPVRPRLAHLFL